MLRRLLSVLRHAAIVARATFFMFIIDHLPLRMRRRVLRREYSGEALEQRLQMKVFGGMAMVRALWHMTGVNEQPQVAVGMLAPPTPVLKLRGERAMMLPDVGGSAEVPLVLNFGSCS